MLRTIVIALAFLSAAACGAPAHAEPCESFGQSTRRAEIAEDTIDEASGLAASWRYDNMWWTHNDSGGEARLFLIQEDGSTVAQVRLEGVDKAHDFEDLAVGPCQKGSKQSCVYIGDIGDNKKKRDKVVVYRFAEPDLPDKRPAEVAVQVDDAWFTYPGGPRDAEALMIHPDSAKLYVIEKRMTHDSRVYSVPRQGFQRDTTSLKLALEVAKLRMNGPAGFGTMITAGDIAPSGEAFSVRTYLHIYTYCAPKEDFESAFGATPALTRPPFLIQSEALGYERSGEALWITSETRPAPLYRLERKD